MCMVGFPESTRQRLESSQPENHEDRIASKVFTLMSHFYLVHKFVPMPQAMKIPDARVAVHKELELAKNQERKGGYSGTRKCSKRKSTLLH